MSRVDLTALASSQLLDGEQVVAGVRVKHDGLLPPADGDGGFPSARQMALVLTPARLLVWSLGISGRPKQYLGEVPLGTITAVEAGRVQFGSSIRISLRSGAVVDLEALGGERGEEFGRRLGELADRS